MASTLPRDADVDPRGEWQRLSVRPITIGAEPRKRDVALIATLERLVEGDARGSGEQQSPAAV